MTRHAAGKHLKNTQRANSDSPRISLKTRHQLRQLLLAATVSGALIAAPRMAKTADHTLMGAQTTPETITDNDANVTTDPGFSVTLTSNGMALSITGNGAIVYNDANSSPLTGFGVGYSGLSISSTADSTNAGSVTVSTGGDIAGFHGISATNLGTGAMSITTTGTVTGTGSDGINAVNGTGSIHPTDLTIHANNASGAGGGNGILATNHGTGATNVTVTGTASATGGGSGISVSHYGANTGLTVTANNASGAFGITASNFAGSGSTGTTTITAHGNVTGTGTGNFNSAIYAYNDYSSGTVTVNTDNPAATITGNIGIEVANAGVSSATNITTDGIVEGSKEGILERAYYGNTGAATITIDGTSTVRNTSLSSADSAIQTGTVGGSGGATTIQNNGTVLGTATLSNYGNTFNNTNIWNMAGGISDFGTGTNILNNSGYFLGANTAGGASTTINDIGTVNNTGSIIMQNMDSHIGGGTAYANDVTTFANGGAGNFVSNGGSLYIDTDLVNGTSDKLVVDNVTLPEGNLPTKIYVQPVGNNGVATIGDGIEVVQVLGGESDAGAFILGGSVHAGLYSYSLSQGAAETEDANNWYLQSNDIVNHDASAAAELPILGSRTALATLSNLDDRQRDTKVLSDDPHSLKGVWGRVFGENNKFESNQSSGFGYDTNLWGAQAGIDLLAGGDDAGNRNYAGLYVSYASSSGDALQDGAKVGRLDLDATTLGAYYTKYSAKGWYLDGVAQYSWLNGINAETATDDVHTGGSSYALSLEAGQQFHRKSKIVREVQAQLIDQYTSVDDVTLSDDTQFNLSDLNSVTGRFGVRLYGNPKAGKKFLPWARANLYHTFTGDSQISSLGDSIDTPIGGTSGEVQLGFTDGSANSGGWSIYGSAGYLFDISGAKYSGWEGTLGLRKGL